MPEALSHALHPVLATSFLDPLYKALAAVLAFFYSLVPNYAIAIALLTVAVMVVLFPLTWKSTRSMIGMQQLQPEMKKLQAKYKGDRQKLNEEMMALYKEYNVNPMSGCLPVVLQFPVFFVLYRVIANLTHSVKVTAQNVASLSTGGHSYTVGETVCQPQHISQTSALYKHIIQHATLTGTGAGCHMKSFGLDLAHSATTTKGAAVVGFWILVGLVVFTQYIQTRQLNGRNPAAAANPQAKMMQRVMPIVFGFISISIPAGVNVYFLVSSLFRIAQQEGMYRWDPHLAAHAAKAKTIDVPSREKRPPGGGTGPAKGGPRQSTLSRLLGLGPAAGSGGTAGGTGPAKGGPSPTKGGPSPAKGGPAPGREPGGEPRQGTLSRLLGLAPPAGSGGTTGGTTGGKSPGKPTPPSTNGRSGSPSGANRSQPPRNRSRKRSKRGR